MPHYPSSVTEVLDPPVVFRPATVEVVESFARNRPWTGTLETRKQKFNTLHADLCRIYGRHTTLLW